jgi:ATP-binding cassette subfamily B protein
MWDEFKSIFRTASQVWRLLARRQRLSLSFALAIMLVTGALSSFPPVILGRLVDRMLSKAASPSLSGASNYLLLLIGAVLVREALQVLRKYLVENAITQVEKKTLVEVIARMLRVDLNFFGPDMKIGALHGRMHRSIEGLVRMLKLSFLDFFPAAVTALCALVVVSTKNPLLAVAMGSVIPFAFFIVLAQLSTQKGIRIDLLRAKEEIDGRAVELFGGIESVRAANTESLETEKLEQAAEHLRSKEIRHHVCMAFYDSLKYLNEGAFLIIVLCLSIYLAGRGVISIGDILTYSLLFGSIVNPLREVHRVLDEAHESSIRVADLIDLREKPVDQSYVTRQSEPAALRAPAPTPHIEVKNIRFSYPTSGRKGGAINGITLAIAEGQKIGIVGHSGCGKSTWLKLLLRLYHPQSGSILISGRPLDTFSRKDIAAEFAYVSQSPFLFSGTMEENIRYGCGDVSSDQVMVAARKANIHDEIMAMPNGYQTLVAEKGSNLSGGQRQRIAIARIFLKKPRVLLLDEATAALDNSNERAVQNALSEAMLGRTVLTVAHRLSTLRYADRILVFQNGRVAEEGTYEELLRLGGTFSRLHRAA